MDGECEPPWTGSRRVFRTPPEAAAASGIVATLKWLIFAGLTMLALSGCGFHLQGSVALPQGVRSVYLATSDELTPFAAALKQSIQHSGAAVANTASDADTVLRITKDRNGRRVRSNRPNSPSAS